MAHSHASAAAAAAGSADDLRARKRRLKTSMNAHRASRTRARQWRRLLSTVLEALFLAFVLSLLAWFYLSVLTRPTAYATSSFIAGAIFLAFSAVTKVARAGVKAAAAQRDAVRSARVRYAAAVLQVAVVLAAAVGLLAIVPCGVYVVLELGKPGSLAVGLDLGWTVYVMWASIGAVVFVALLGFVRLRLCVIKAEDLREMVGIEVEEGIVRGRKKARAEEMQRVREGAAEEQV